MIRRKKHRDGTVSVSRERIEKGVTLGQVFHAISSQHEQIEMRRSAVEIPSQKSEEVLPEKD